VGKVQNNVSAVCPLTRLSNPRKVFRIGTVHYNWPMSAHASQAFSIAHCTDSEDLPNPNPNRKPDPNRIPKLSVGEAGGLFT